MLQSKKIKPNIIKLVGLVLFFCLFSLSAFAADIRPPTGSIKINNGASSTNTINVTLNLSATDSGSGVAQMQFSNNGSTWSTPEAYSTTKTWVLSYGSGTRRVYVKYKDNAGNWSRSYYDSISLLKQTPQLGTITPSSGTSSPSQAVNFTTTYSDSNGWQDIKIVYFLVNTSISGTNCSWVYYDQNTNKLYLRNNTNSRWLGGYAPGSSYVIENSYSKLDCSKTTVLGDNTNLTITWNLTFKSTFTGTKNTYLYVKDDKNAYNSWTQKGTWTVQQGLSVSVEPKLWDIGSTEVNQVVTMGQANKITVTNNGAGPETYDLKLIDPLGWSSSTTPGIETYVLSGLFCNANDVPQANNFNQDATNEDVITTVSKKATNAIFAYTQSTASGVAVPSAAIRSLYLQFKSPTVTQKKEEQNISIIVSCQIP